MRNRHSALCLGALAAAFGIGILAAWLLPARFLALAEAALLPTGYLLFRCRK